MREGPIELAKPLSRFSSLFADVAARFETDPAAWQALWREPELRAIAYVGVPQEYNPYPFSGAGLSADICDYPLHLAVIEQLSRSGASALMGLPSSSLSTSVISKLATPAQQAQFFAPFATGPSFSFFAVTEPARGSDATQVETRIDRTPGGWVLNGAKTLIGGADGAQSGLVLARNGTTGQLVFVLLSGPHNGETFAVARLNTTGLMGAGLCRLTFTDHILADEAVVSANARVPALIALSGVFERHRPMVAAMALGTARGMLDRLAAFDRSHRLAGFELAHQSLLHRMIGLASSGNDCLLDVNATSTLKLGSVDLVDQVRAACSAIAGSALFSDPDLRRFWRDAGAFEYMEGTSTIHALNVYRAYAAERINHADAS